MKIHDFSMQYNEHNIQLKFKNLAEFQKYFMFQNSNNWWWIKETNGFEKWVKQKVKNILDITLSMTHLNFNSILDIGSGMSLFTIALKQIKPDLKIYLLDYDGHSLKKGQKFYNLDSTISYYNSWAVVKDILESTNLDKNDFTFLSPDDKFPENLDFIRSKASWCWHYPFEVYWNKVKESLITGGQLWVDIVWRQDKDVVKEISDFMNSAPKHIQLMHKDIFKNRIRKDNPPQECYIVNDHIGGSYCWDKIINK